MATQLTEKRLYRSRDDAFVGGVCAGIADYFDLDPIVVRILAVLFAGLTLGVAGVVYIALWARLPREPEVRAPYDVLPESAESSAFGCVDCVSASLKDDERPASSLPLVARLAVAAGLMLLFLAVAISVAPLLPGTQWWQFWPLAALMGGLCLIVIPIRTRYEAAWHALGIILMSVSASILPMTLGIMSWNTIPAALQLLWPIVVLGLALFAVGIIRRIDALVVAGAFCIVAFCLMALTFCVVPGHLETLWFQSPTGRTFKITVVP